MLSIIFFIVTYLVIKKLVEKQAKEKGWSNDRKVLTIVGICLGICLLLWMLPSGGASNEYYQYGYEYGYEEGTDDEYLGHSYASESEMLNESRYKFFRKYSFDSEEEKNKALENYIKGFKDGYEDGWKN